MITDKVKERLAAKLPHLIHKWGGLYYWKSAMSDTKPYRDDIVTDKEYENNQ